jgi:pilus assembly protein CpaB
MNARSRKTKILLLALILGVAAAAMVFTFLASQKTETPMVQVVAAASNIPANTKLTADMLKMSSFPADSVPPGYFRDSSELVDMVAKADLRIDRPILKASLVPPGIVPSGMRAVTIGLDQVIGVAGFLKPGDRVDVIATYDLDSNTYTRTVLQNAELLAIGPDAGENSGTSKPNDKVESKVASTATLAVMPQDAEKLFLADSKGKLRLTLRPPEDRSIVSSRPQNARSIMGVAPSRPSGSSAAATRAPGPAPLLSTWTEPTVKPCPPLPIAAPGKEIEIVRGPEKTIAVVKQ